MRIEKRKYKFKLRYGDKIGAYKHRSGRRFRYARACSYCNRMKGNKCLANEPFDKEGKPLNKTGPDAGFGLSKNNCPHYRPRIRPMKAYKYRLDDNFKRKRSDKKINGKLKPRKLVAK